MPGPKTRTSKEFRSLVDALNTFRQAKGVNLLNMLQSLFQREEPPPPIKQMQHATIAPFKPSGMDYGTIWGEAYPTIKGDFLGRAVGAVRRPEGVRFYAAQATDPDAQRATDLAEMMIPSRMYTNPADSVRTRDVPKLFKYLTPGAFKKARQLINNENVNLDRYEPTKIDRMVF